MIILRKLSNQEMADLPSRWENPTVDTNKYYQSAMEIWEIEKEGYDILKPKGVLVQEYKGKYYAGR